MEREGEGEEEDNNQEEGGFSGCCTWVAWKGEDVVVVAEGTEGGFPVVDPSRTRRRTSSLCVEMDEYEYEGEVEVPARPRWVVAEEDEAVLLEEWEEGAILVVEPCVTRQRSISMEVEVGDEE